MPIVKIIVGGAVLAVVLAYLKQVPILGCYALYINGGGNPNAMCLDPIIYYVLIGVSALIILWGVIDLAKERK